MNDGLVKRSELPAAAPTTPPQAASRDVLAFSLADEAYALPLASVHEILKVPPITPVPRAAADVLGIVSVRGRITTVLDLRRRLGLPEHPLGPRARILLVDSGVEIFGLLVDNVHQVHRLAPEEVELANVLSGELMDHVVGVGRPGKKALDVHGSSDELLILLAPEPLLRREP